MSRKANPYRGDVRTRAAKQQGYPARSVFKLDEIDQRVGLLSPGKRVLDLGAAPGSWTLYTSKRVAAKGLVVAIDLQEIRQTFDANVQVLQADATQISAMLLDRYAAFDVVLSDMAPSTTGNKLRDQAGSFELFMSALELADRLGKKGSHFVGKLFMGPDFEAAKRQLAHCYLRSKVIRPRGTRQQSSEVFLVGIDKRSATCSVL
jgi:23S rRNA (uridine2552-2'-O)-methyltransferase